jgi:magnesium chelatase family protein
LLDRIDIHIQVPRVDYDKLSDDRYGESSATIQERVETARDIQRRRFSTLDLKKNQAIFSNADMRASDLRQFCILDDSCRKLIRAAMNQMQLSARAYHRILKLARTNADLANFEAITPIHLAEALQYRPKSF